jgi:DNA polymerase-1
MGLPTHKKTKKKTGYSTDMEVMTMLARDYPIAEHILNYRTLAKLKGTYIDALPKLVNPETGRVHTSYNQTVAATGRLSSSDPNLQNIPIRGEEGRKIRRAFVPEPGWKLISADYSQIELRVLAHYSQDATLTRAFLEGEDVHTRTASEVFGVVPELMDPEMRRRAKVINFGIIYGMSGFGLARELGIGRKEAETYIKNYFARLPGVQRFIKENLLRARADGFVITLLGRRRYLPQIKSKNHAMRSLAERIATNTPIQGSAADIIKLAMIRIMDEIDQNKLETKMIMQVHDELVLEVPEKEVDQASRIIRNCMENCIRLDVPLIVDMNVGSSWAEAH